VRQARSETMSCGCDPGREHLCREGGEVYRRFGERALKAHWTQRAAARTFAALEIVLDAVLEKGQ
jgi:hypothetical protein